MRIIRLLLENILPVRQISDAQKKANRYEVILTSIKAVGLVEPLVVFPQKGQPGKYTLVNGHMRYYAMKELELTFADCLVANDDEGFTYNARISRLPAIQEHKMITRAVKNGASLERIAAALNISPRLVQASMNLLNGINDEAVELLKDKPISPAALRMMKKVTGERQIEIARMMIEANNYYAGYVEGLVLGTRLDLLVATNLPKKKKGMSPEAIAKMEQEMETLESGMKAITDNYKENMFTLQTAHTYVKALLKNTRVAKYLKAKHAEINTEFENMAAAEPV
ncbi:MAG: ParB N-terminal domain-containing protein [Verrucomicrobia subdivision 3 bacterium]|nr:ParB N-terminal domain-containing protein [Limisphaerales bacterium]